MESTHGGLGVLRCTLCVKALLEKFKCIWRLLSKIVRFTPIQGKHLLLASNVLGLMDEGVNVHYYSCIVPGLK
jgi:hypothetical protein